ncbi:class I SAM-dependent methyltransferase [Kitasatospora sp. MMS16-BH015]|uniref:class I SAM-dependent methyltransferase n=1 Tax=Kitasatospora sp. MMS16-BH015 TaxID=2018025 RepID=UPI000CF2EE69|nr:class I SAM-dependent methyltransferase [Kitasatospora sp. MMS16-BH015]
MTTATPAVPRTPDDVPGWFWKVDQDLFSWFLSRQSAAGVSGDLLELGTYLGRSAILLGQYLQEGETFTVCDLFDSEAPDESNSAEMAMSYRKTLTRAAFETNYLTFHPRLPEIVQAPTSALADGRIPAGSCRFVHIDASHLYEHVAGDIRVAREALAPDGLVVLDDYRSPHTPGVAAAVWEAVADLGLRPVCLTPEKFYGTWGDAEAAKEVLLSRDWQSEGFRTSEDLIAGSTVHRLAWDAPAPTRRPVSHPTARRLAHDLLPPIAFRALRRTLKGGV